MKKNDIVSAWRDEDAFLSMDEQDRAQMPEHPAGIRTLSDQEVEGAFGAAAGTHYSHCEPTASWCDDCGGVEILIPAR
jgi:mersacidin/lichenicidin family type 2 lantibiotic